MSQVATYRDKKQVVPIPYPPGGCPVIEGDDECGETQGLDIIKDFHQLYQDKMSEIDVSAGGDSLQEKVNLQQKWIDDLTEQNKMLAKVIEELESEAIGRLQNLENKLKNAAKSFSEEDVKALADKDRKIKELEEALKAQPSSGADVGKETDPKSQENAKQGIGSDRQGEEVVVATKVSPTNSGFPEGTKDEAKDKNKLEEKASKNKEPVFFRSMSPSSEKLRQGDDEDGTQREGTTQDSRKKDGSKVVDESVEKKGTSGSPRDLADSKRSPEGPEATKQGTTDGSANKVGSELDDGTDEKKGASGAPKDSAESTRTPEGDDAMKQGGTQDVDNMGVPLCPVKKGRPCNAESCRKPSTKPTEPTSSTNKDFSDPANQIDDIQKELPSSRPREDTKEDEENATPLVCSIKKKPCPLETCRKKSVKSSEPTPARRSNSVGISNTSVGRQDASKSKLADNLEKKSVHLLIENNKENMVVEPEKDYDQGSMDISRPRIESVPVIGVQDSLEILKGTVKTQNSDQSVANEETPNSDCACETNEFVQELKYLQEENKMLREGEEIRRLKNELDEKMKRILELNEENRTLNDMVNTLKSNQVIAPGSEPASAQPVSTTSSAYGSDLPTEEEMKTEPLTGETKDYLDEIPTESTKVGKDECTDILSPGEEPADDVEKVTADAISPTEGQEPEKTPPDDVAPTEMQQPIDQKVPPDDVAPTEVQEQTGQKVPPEDVTPTQKQELNDRKVTPDDGTPTEGTEKSDQKVPPDDKTPTEGQEKIDQKVPSDDKAPANEQGQSEQKPLADATPGEQPEQVEIKKPKTADKGCQEPCICTPDEEDKSKPQQPPGVSDVGTEPSHASEKPETETCEKPSTLLGKGEESSPAEKEGALKIVDDKPTGEEGKGSKPTAEDGKDPSTIVSEKDPTMAKDDDKPTATDGQLASDEEPSSSENAPPKTEDADKPSSTDEKPSSETDNGPSPDEEAAPKFKDADKPTNADEKPLAEGDKDPLESSNIPSNEVEKPSSETDKGPSPDEEATPKSKDADKPTNADEKPLTEGDKEPIESSNIPNTADEKPPTEADNVPSTVASEKPSTTVAGAEPSSPPSEKPSTTTKDEQPTKGATEDPSKEVAQKPSDIPTEKGDDVKRSDLAQPDKDTVPISKPRDQPDKFIIRCICKSKYCRVVPDPDNPNQQLCVDVSEPNIEPDDEDDEGTCVCSSCPKKDGHSQSGKPGVSVEEKDKSSGPDAPHPVDGTRQATLAPKEVLIYSSRPIQGLDQHYSSIRSFHSDTHHSFNSLNRLSKEQEYAGLSRKETESWEKRVYIAPRKSASLYGIQEDATDTSDLKDEDETRNADLKIVIADLKNKLLDAEDKIEELKNIKNFGNRDNNTALIMRYSEEIEHLKKSLKWSSKEKEEYELLKQKVKLLEQGKGDTENITSNLKTADDRSVMKVQLKKLSKKNKCYEEIVQFFKEEMSVMSDELLTLQEVLNVTNVSSQEENTRLINAILQLRRINDRLVNHLCEIEKQVVLENQINQINEARINELQNIIGSKNTDLNHHDQTIQEMRKKLNNATKQNADLKKTIKNLTDAVVEIQEGIKSVERDHNRNKNDVSVVESKVCLASGNLKDIKVCIEQKNDKIVELENKLKSQEISIILATKELEVLKEKKADYKKLVMSLKEQLASYDKKNEEIMNDYQLVSNQLQDYVNLDHMKNYELNHYKSLVEEMKMSLIQLNLGLEKFESSNIHFYEDVENSDNHCDNCNTSGVFNDLRKSMADMRRRLSDAEFKGGLIEEELLKVKESHMTQIREEVTESQKELETRILASIEEQANLNVLVEQQKEEIELLKKELQREKLEATGYKRSVCELKNEKLSSSAQMEILHLKCELNKSLQRQRVLSEENDKIHSKMISLRKKLSTIEQAYEVMKQDNEEYKMQLKKTLREKEYIAHKNQELTKNIEDMRSSHDQLERQCRSMMKRMSQEKNWVKKPMQQPFSPRRYTPSPQSDRRSSSPSRNQGQERHSSDVRYRSMSPWRNCGGYPEIDLVDEDDVSNKTHILRNISYDSNPSAFTSRSPSPRSDYLQEVEMNNMNLNDWFSPNFKETDTDADDGDDEMFINKLHVLTAQVQEANKRWQQKMNTKSVPTSRAKSSNY